MLQKSEISNDHLIRALRIYVEDLTSKHSPFNKTPEYLRDLASWIACAATRIDSLVPKDLPDKHPSNDWEKLKGLPMSEIKIGMKLKNTTSSLPVVTVTELTDKGFKYIHAPYSWGTRMGWSDSGECYGSDGYSYYEEHRTQNPVIISADEAIKLGDKAWGEYKQQTKT